MSQSQMMPGMLALKQILAKLIFEFSQELSQEDL